MKRRRTKLEEASFSIDDKIPDRRQDQKIEIPSWEVGPAEKLLTDELKGILDKAIMKLPMDYRVVFVLRDIESLPGEEVAEILNISLPAVKSRLRRARLFLRNELQPYVE